MFIYNEELDTWLFGEPFNGIGVFFQGFRWYANIVIHGDMVHLGPYGTLTEAQDAGIHEFNSIKENNA